MAYDLTKLLAARNNFQQALPDGPMPVYAKGATEPSFELTRELATHCGYGGLQAWRYEDSKHIAVDRDFALLALLVADVIYEAHDNQLLPQAAFGEDDTSRIHIQLDGNPFVIRYHGPTGAASEFPDVLTVHQNGSVTNSKRWDREAVETGLQALMIAYLNFDKSLLSGVGVAQDNHDARMAMPGVVKVDYSDPLYFMPPPNPITGKPDKRYSYWAYKDSWSMGHRFGGAIQIHPAATHRERMIAKSYGIYR